MSKIQFEKSSRINSDSRVFKIDHNHTTSTMRMATLRMMMNRCGERGRGKIAMREDCAPRRICIEMENSLLSSTPPSTALDHIEDGDEKFHILREDCGSCRICIEMETLQSTSFVLPSPTINSIGSY